MPFDIQTKGFIIGVIVGAIVLPRVMAAVKAKKS